jgi:hypothetical protein
VVFFRWSDIRAPKYEIDLAASPINVRAAFRNLSEPRVFSACATVDLETSLSALAARGRHFLVVRSESCRQKLSSKVRRVLVEPEYITVRSAEAVDKVVSLRRIERMSVRQVKEMVAEQLCTNLNEISVLMKGGIGEMVYLRDEWTVPNVSDLFYLRIGAVGNEDDATISRIAGRPADEEMRNRWAMCGKNEAWFERALTH